MGHAVHHAALLGEVGFLRAALHRLAEAGVDVGCSPVGCVILGGGGGGGGGGSRPASLFGAQLSQTVGDHVLDVVVLLGERAVLGSLLLALGRVRAGGGHRTIQTKPGALGRHTL